MESIVPVTTRQYTRHQENWLRIDWRCTDSAVLGVFNASTTAFVEHIVFALWEVVSAKFNAGRKFVVKFNPLILWIIN